MRYVFPDRLRLPNVRGDAGRALGPALSAGLPNAADATIFFSTRTFKARARPAAPSSLFERARRRSLPSKGAAPRVWSDFDDNAHAGRRAPPGRNPGGGGQGKPDRGI